MSNSFLPARLNFPIWKGSTFRYLFQWIDDNGTERKPHDMTGFKGECQLLGPNAEVLFELKGEQAVPSESAGIKFPGAGHEGYTELFIDAKDTEAFTWRKASYTLFLTEPFKAPEPDVFPMLSGVFTVSTAGSVQ